MYLTVDMLELNIPFLPGLDIMDRYRIFVKTVANRLFCFNEGIDLPEVRKHGLVYDEWGVICSTISQSYNASIGTSSTLNRSGSTLSCAAPRTRTRFRRR